MAFNQPERPYAKVWNNQTIVDSDVSSILDCSSYPSSKISIFGNIEATVPTIGKTITLQLSEDGLIFEPSQYYQTIYVGVFGFDCVSTSKFVRLIYNGVDPITISAFISTS